MVPILLSEEINKEIYMPKKLIEAELPDDYPQELDYLFKKNYLFLQEIYLRMIATGDGIDKIQRELFNELQNEPQNDIPYIAYLAWLAKHTIPQYYSEYMLINSRIGFQFLNIDKELDEKIYSISFYHNFFHKGDSYALSLFNYCMTIFRDDTNKAIWHDVWLRVKIIETRYVEILATRPSWLTRVQIIDDISSIFPFEELTIHFVYTGARNLYNTEIDTLIAGAEYLIPLKWNQHWDINRENNKTLSPLVYPSVQLERPMLIENEQFTTYDNQRLCKTPLFTASDEISFTRQIFGEKSTYQNAREKIISAIEELSNYMRREK
jgi:hypothetical protein